MFKRSFFIVALLMSAAVIPAHADDMTGRVDALENQVRQLVGQIEELNYTIKQMQGQLAEQPKKMGSAEPVEPTPMPKKKVALQLPDQPEVTGQAAAGGVEIIQDAPVTQEATIESNGAAPAPAPLGSAKNRAAQAEDGGFQGQVLVPPAEEQVAGAGVEAVSLQPETPDDLFLRAEKSLLQLQYGDAEAGFREFLAKYPDHNLAGSAQYKLGETFYAQQNYSESARNYLAGYKTYPKSRRAADSLMKLGLSLNRLGQKDQGCAFLGAVGTEYPNSVEAKKRAQVEYKRAAC